MASWTATVNQNVIRVVSVGTQGPIGPPGPSASIIVLAGENLGGQRVVYLANNEAFHADKDTPAHRGKVVGLTQTAALLGANVIIQTTADITDPSWTWVPGPVYLGLIGVMTQTAPLTGFVQEIGQAINATKININLQQPIVR